MKLKDKSGKFIRDTWENRIKVLFARDEAKVVLVCLLLILAVYELA